MPCLKKKYVPKKLECILCGNRFTVDAIDKTYFIETLVCKDCYDKLQRQPYSITCFGKRTKRTKTHKMLFGYDENAPECSRECPDRNICRQYAEKS